MFFTSKRARALRDAKELAGLLTQLGIPFALEAEGVIVAGDDTGQKLCAQQAETSDRDGIITWFDASGRDYRFRGLSRALRHHSFNGQIHVFRDITEQQKSLEDSERRLLHMEADKKSFSDALNNVSFPIWIENETHQILYQNSKYTEHFGITTPQAVKEIVNEARGGKGLLRRMTGAIVKGERRQLEVKVQPLPDKRVVAWAPDRSDFMEEIGNRDRILTAQRTLFEQLHTAVAMFDQNHRLTFYNTAYAHLWDMDDAWLNGKPKLDEILERLRESRRLPEQADFRSYKNFWRNQFTELLAPVEDMMYLPDGRTLRMLTVPNPTGGLMQTFEDVTSTLELESSLNTQMAVQRETLDHMTEAMAVFGGDGRIKLWNPQYAKLWGLYPEDLNGDPHITTLVDVMIKCFAKSAQAKQKQVLLGTALDRSERKGRFVFEDGRHVNHMAVPLPDGATLLAYDDVTDAVV